MIEPLPYELLRRFLDGSTADELAAELGIPADAVEVRIRAATESIIRHGFDHPIGRTLFHRELND